MIRANSIIKLNLPQIRKLTKAQVTALELTGEALHIEVTQEQVFPRDTGNLQDESTFVDYSQAKTGKVTLSSTTPYAREVYFHPEYNFKTDENPNARGEWYEDWLPGGDYEEFCREAFKKLYRRLGGL